MASVKLPRLIVAASDSNADMLYATGFRVPDAFLFLENAGRSSVMLSDLEVDRGRREARVDDVIAYSDVEAKVRGRSKKSPPYDRVAARFLSEQNVSAVVVPKDFPLGLARELIAAGIEITPAKGHFWPQRELKTREEVGSLEKALALTETAMQRAFEILRASRIKSDRSLTWKNAPLTSERLRTEIESVILRCGGVAMNNSIVACGEQACDPHERGHGPLLANSLIILDVFPRDAATGFFGDLTRTVVRGRASDAQRRLWEVCLRGQKNALRALRPGANGGAIQDETRNFFTNQGYPTALCDGHWTGFFHGLGHGLGLEIHEEPRLARVVLKPGQVFTIEPGLYVPGIGGVRHEDVALITPTGKRLLSSLDKPFEL